MFQGTYIHVHVDTSFLNQHLSDGSLGYVPYCRYTPLYLRQSASLLYIARV